MDIQTTAVHGTPQDIRRETRRLWQHLGTKDGGFIGYVEDYHSIGMSEENYLASVEALRSLGY